MQAINCDQVAWLLDIANRHLPQECHPRISRKREMQRYAMLYEIMEILNLKFEDGSAAKNGTPGEVFAFSDFESDMLEPNKSIG